MARWPVMAVVISEWQSRKMSHNLLGCDLVGVQAGFQVSRY